MFHKPVLKSVVAWPQLVLMITVFTASADPEADATEPWKHHAPARVTLQTTRDRVEVPIEFGLNLPCVAVTLDDRHECWFLLDTGANCSLIDQSYVKTFSLDTIGRGEANGRTVPMVRVTTLKMGGVRAEMNPRGMAAFDFSAISEMLGRPVVGSLGMDVLGQQPFTIDYAAERLTVFAPDTFKPPSDATSIPVGMINERAVVRVHIDQTETDLRVLIDTGTTGLVLDDLTADQRDALLAHSPFVRGELTRPQAAIYSRQATVRSLHVMGSELPRVVADIVEPAVGTADHARLVHGKLGTEVLQQFPPCSTRPAMRTAMS